MKQFVVPCVVLLLMPETVPKTALADKHPVAHCGSVRAIVSTSGLTVVPFAVPVAVPVATVQVPTVLYSYSASGAAHPTAPASTDIGAHVDTAEEATSIIQQACVRCHGGEAPQAGLSLESLDGLSREQRLEAVARLVSDDPDLRMPRGATLAPAEIGRVLQALSGALRE